jgi:hypothetical protein
MKSVTFAAIFDFNLSKTNFRQSTCNSKRFQSLPATLLSAKQPSMFKICDTFMEGSSEFGVEMELSNFMKNCQFIEISLPSISPPPLPTSSEFSPVSSPSFVIYCSIFISLAPQTPKQQQQRRRPFQKS